MPSILKQARHHEFARSVVAAVKSIYSTERKAEDVATHLRTSLSRSRSCSRCRRHHPVVTLPPELLAHVFVIGSEDDAMLPMAVSHVCRSWRTLALHTPSLWRRVTLDGRLYMWQKRIHRARACALDIQLLPRPQEFAGIVVVPILDAYTVMVYMNVVAPLVHRLRTLEVHFDAYALDLWNAALSACCAQSTASQAPALQELILVYPGNDDTREFVLFGGAAPRLRRVTLCGIRLSWLPSLFENLTFLDYTHHGFTRGQEAAADVLSMLRVSARLHELQLAFPWRGDVHAASTPCSAPLIVTLPQLVTLVLSVEGPEIPPAVLTVLAHTTCSALRNLRLHSTYPFHRPSLFPRLRYVARVLPPLPALEVLHIEYGWLDARFVFPLLSSLPRLKHLTVKGARVTGPFLFGLVENLSARRTQAGMVTRLRVLELVGCDMLGTEDVIRAFQPRPGRSRHGIDWLLVRECPAIGSVAMGKLSGLGLGVKIWPVGAPGRGEGTVRRKVIHRHI